MEQHELLTLINACCPQNRHQTRERLWLRQKCESFYVKKGFSKKAEGDAYLYREVFGRLPQSPSDILKIRYWRTGHASPQNRELLLTLGRVLALDDPDITYLVCSYYDRSDRCFTCQDADDPVLRKRLAHMAELKEEFVRKLHPLYLRSLHIQQSNSLRYFRHLYYLESQGYVFRKNALPQAPPLAGDHLQSVPYASTLHNIMELTGEIPRKTMLRHLLLLMAPFVSRNRLDNSLKRLGYLPLTAEHELPGGGKLDAMLLLLLDKYETECADCEPEDCLSWLKQTFTALDRLLSETGNPELSLMQYKSIRKEEKL